jgi:hypothetical protein
MSAFSNKNYKYMLDIYVIQFKLNDIFQDH